MEETISLKEIFVILKTRLSLILVSTLIGVVVAGILTFFVITPQYSSRAQLIVSQPQSGNGQDLNDVNYNLQILNTYKDIITEGDALGSTVQERLASEYDLKMTQGQIKESMEVEQSQDSQMFSIVVTTDSAVDAEHIANTAAEVFQETVNDILNNVDKITIISRAVADPKPVSPNNKLNIAIGLILGLLVGVGLAFLIELLDRTVKDSSYVTDQLGMTVLGSVPEMSTKEIAATTRKLPRAHGNANNKQTSDSRRRRKKV